MLFRLFIVFSSTLLLGLNLSAQKQLDLRFEHEQIDLGEITRGDVIDTSFTFTNTGLDTLRIDLVSGCECTTLDWPRKAIAPGDSATIDVIFDSTEKEESGDVEIDVIFKNIIEEIDAPFFRFVSYSFVLKEE